MTLSHMLDLVYPRVCAGCSSPLTRDPGHVCWDCLAGLNIITHPYCALCGDPVDGMVEGSYVCDWCRQSAPAFDTARSAARYRGSLSNILQNFKYGGATWVGNDLAGLLAACARTQFGAVRFDAVVCVPLHHTKERERTFNQAALLAAGLAAELGLQFFPRALRRVRSTPTQTSLGASARRANVKKAFEVAHPGWVLSRRLLLVDDTMTTGATVAECSRMLKQAGAAAVHVLTVARG